jgi:hypothetical protein
MSKKKHLKMEIGRLTAEIHQLRDKNEELSYMLNDLQDSLDIANGEAVREMLRTCGQITIEGMHTTAQYQDIVGILLRNGYEVELAPVRNGTKLKITIKESEDCFNE